MKRFTLILWGCLSALFSLGQAERGTVNLNILNDQNGGIESATVELLKSTDSSLVKTAL